MKVSLPALNLRLSPGLRTISIILAVVITYGSATAGSIFDLLAEQPDSVVKVTLTLPFDRVLAEMREGHPATFGIVNKDGQEQHWDVKVKSRGRYRRLRCTYPPLRLNFRKSDLRAAGLSEHDKYKLVSQCISGEAGARLLLREYLAYRVQALVTPNAFRVQLLRITYRDAANTSPARTEYAFLLEANDELGERLSAEEMDKLSLHPGMLDSLGETTNALFQYMIANGDYSLPLQRNLKLYDPGNHRLIPVGYDFDFSGWVGAPYATPSRMVGQSSIYERVYLGYAQDDATLLAAATPFLEVERQVVHLVKNYGLLPEDDRKSLSRFVDRFYDRLRKLTRRPEAIYTELRKPHTEYIPVGGDPRDYVPPNRRP